MMVRIRCKAYGPTKEIRPHIPRDIDLILPEIRAVIRECTRGLAPWPLLICGQVGIGKTRAALAVHDWYGGMFWEFATLVRDFGLSKGGMLFDMAHIYAPKIYQQEFWRRISDAALVIVDEIGAKQQTDHSHEALMTLCGIRECRPLMMLTNLLPSEIETAYDDRAASRMTAGTVCVVRGDDRRRVSMSPDDPFGG